MAAAVRDDAAGSEGDRRKRTNDDDDTNEAGSVVTHAGSSDSRVSSETAGQTAVERRPRGSGAVGWAIACVVRWSGLSSASSPAPAPLCFPSSVEPLLRAGCATGTVVDAVSAEWAAGRQLCTRRVSRQQSAHPQHAQPGAFDAFFFDRLWLRDDGVVRGDAAAVWSSRYDHARL